MPSKPRDRRSTAEDGTDLNTLQVAPMRKKAPRSEYKKDAFLQQFETMFLCKGAKPLEKWKVSAKAGELKWMTDGNYQVAELAGASVETTSITRPKAKNVEIGIRLPYLVLIVKNVNQHFSFGVEIKDKTGMKRKFRASTYTQNTTVGSTICKMPMSLDEGWNQINFNLCEFTRRAYSTEYEKTLRVTVHANCRLRLIYFSAVDPRHIPEDVLPKDYKLFIPTAVRNPVAKRMPVKLERDSRSKLKSKLEEKEISHADELKQMEIKVEKQIEDMTSTVKSLEDKLQTIQHESATTIADLENKLQIETDSKQTTEAMLREQLEELSLQRANSSLAYRNELALKSVEHENSTKAILQDLESVKQQLFRTESVGTERLSELEHTLETERTVHNESLAEREQRSMALLEQLENERDSRESIVADLETRLAIAKSEAQVCKENWATEYEQSKQLEAQTQTAKDEIERLEKSVADLSEDLCFAKQKLEEVTVKLQNDVAGERRRADELVSWKEEEMEQQREKMSKVNEELAVSLEEAKAQVQEELESMRLAYEQEKLAKEALVVQLKEELAAAKESAVGAGTVSDLEVVPMDEGGSGEEGAMGSGIVEEMAEVSMDEGGSGDEQRGDSEPVDGCPLVEDDGEVELSDAALEDVDAGTLETIEEVSIPEESGDAENISE